MALGARSRAVSVELPAAYAAPCPKDHWLDIQFWIFYPYNGAGSAEVTVVDVDKTLKLDPMGEHGGDWEHVTCRVDPASQELRAMYLAQHSGGQWLAMGDIPQENGRPVVFSSRHGHASYRSEGSNLSNGTNQSWSGVTWFKFGLINSTAKGSKILDTYKSSDLKGSIQSSLGDIPYAGKATDAIWDAIPDEAKEENGPTGPWMKGSWSGNE